MPSCRYDFDDPDFQQFVNITADFIEFLGNGLPGDIHPWLHYLPSSRYNKVMTMMDRFIKFMRERHAECKENFDPSKYRIDNQPKKNLLSFVGNDLKLCKCMLNTNIAPTTSSSFNLWLCVEGDPKSITDCMLQAQKEAEDEDKEMKDVLTDTHVLMATMDLFGGG